MKSTQKFPRALAFALSIAFVLLWVPRAGWAAEETPQATLKVSASHSEAFAPDAIQWTLRIRFTGPQREALMAKLKTRIAALKELAESMSIPGDSLVTSNYSLDKDWVWNKGKRVFNGFELSQIITVNLPDPSRATRFSDGLSQIADLEVLNMAPRLCNRQSKENEMIRIATREAMEKARALAEAAGAKLGSLYSISDEPIEESFSGYRPLRMKALAAPAAGVNSATDNFLSQKITLGATVYLVYLLK